MLYTDKTIRFTASEIAAYRAQGFDVAKIRTYRQFRQLQNRRARKQRDAETKQEKPIMAKRYGRRRLNGMMEYSDNYDELLASHRRESAQVQAVVFGIIGLIAGVVLAHMFTQWMLVDSRLIRWADVIIGSLISAKLCAQLAPLLWKIIKWGIILTAIVAIGLFVFLLV